MLIKSGRPLQQAHAHFGRLDVVLNNAGYSLVGTVEEASEADVHAVFDTNYFGTLRVIQAALPLLRQQGSGHILGVSSSLGIVAFPLIGFYCATKWAFESLHESLAQEVKAFGIKVTLLEPGAYATEFGSPASLKIAPGMDAYAELRQQIFGRLSNAETRRPASDSGSRPQDRGRGGPAAAIHSRQRGLPMVRVPPMRTASPPGRRGRASRTPRKANHAKAPLDRFNPVPKWRLEHRGSPAAQGLSKETTK